MNFQTKEIYAAELVGTRFKKLREERRISLDDVSFGTKIQKKYLVALEENKFSVFDGDIPAPNFIKSYARFLGLPPAGFLELYKDNSAGAFGSSETGKAKPQKSRLIFSHKFFRNFVLILAGGALLGYIGFEIKRVLTPPLVSVISPPNDYISDVPRVELLGRVGSGAKLRINGQEIFTDEDGSFKENLGLGSGLNVIKLGAQKKYGEENVVYWRIFWSGGEKVSLK